MYEYPMHLDLEAIQRFIPHRAPMLFTSKVSVLAHDHYTGEASWAPGSFVFDGHFPGHPIVPGVMIVEAGAQIAGVGLRAGDPIAGSKAQGNVGLLMAIRKCFFKRPVSAGLTLHYELRTRRIAENIVNITGDVNCVYGAVATLEFVFSQAPLTQIEHLLSDSSTRES
jgi:3-hydroxymyristoyl/3-hydroxydecanoyl-(acyl carrier protein) dehydratase